MKHPTFIRSIFLKLAVIYSYTIILVFVSVYGAPGNWKPAAAHFQEEGKQAIRVCVIEQNSKTISFIYISC